MKVATDGHRSVRGLLCWSLNPSELATAPPATCREPRHGRVAGGVTAVSWLVPATWSRVGATVCRLWVLVRMVEQEMLRLRAAGTSTSDQSTAVRLPLRCSGRGALLLLSSSFLPSCSTAECSPSCVPCSMATSWAGHHSRRGEVLREFGPARARELATRLGAQRSTLPAAR